jgi:RNA polymerase sigma-70 factor (ECF subfamily)
VAILAGNARPKAVSLYENHRISALTSVEETKKQVRIVTFLSVMRYRGDVDRYGAYYRQHKDKLFAYLMRMTGDYHLSSDIMQESFTRCLERYGQQPPNLPLLYTIARNALFDHWRREEHRSLREGDQADCSGDQESALMVREEYRRVLLAMEKLEKDERDLLALAISGELTYREIASIASISEANVKVKVHRARLRLRDTLQRGDM